MRAMPVLLGGTEPGLRPPAAEPPALDALSFLACLEHATSSPRSGAAVGAPAGYGAGRAVASEDGQPEESPGDGSGSIQAAVGTVIAAQIAAVLGSGVPAPAAVAGEPAGAAAPAAPGAALGVSPSDVASVAAAGPVQVAAVEEPHEAGASGPLADVPGQPQPTPPTSPAPGATDFARPSAAPTDRGRPLAEVPETRVRRSSASAAPARTDGAGRLAEGILAGERRPSPGLPAVSAASSPSAGPAGTPAQPAASHSPVVGLAGSAPPATRPESPSAGGATAGAGLARSEGPAMAAAARRRGSDGAPEEAPGPTVPRRSAEVREAPESAASGGAAPPAATPAAREARLEPGNAVPPAGGSPQPRAMGVGEQIIAHAHLFSTASGKGVRIHLRPPELGNLDVRLVVESGQVTLHVATDTASTRGVIESAWPALRESLAERGLHAQRLVVEHGIPGDAPGAFTSSGQNEPPPHQSRHAYGQEVAARDAPAISRPRLVAGDPGRSGGLIDYRI